MLCRVLCCVLGFGKEMAKVQEGTENGLLGNKEFNRRVIKPWTDRQRGNSKAGPRGERNLSTRGRGVRLLAKLPEDGGGFTARAWSQGLGFPGRRQRRGWGAGCVICQ